jgi:Galactose oxidase, central domain/Kelch motif
MTTRRSLAPVLAALLLASTAGQAPGAVAASSGPVTADTSLGNGIATGAVTDSDPGHARVTVSNNFHFWAGVDTKPATGAADLEATDPRENTEGVYSLVHLIGPNATSAWSGTFGDAGGSQAVWVHFDLATPSGAEALALTCLTIVADTFGKPLLAPSAANVQHAVRIITDLQDFAELLKAVQQPGNIWGIGSAWSLLLQSSVGRAAIIEALAELGVTVTDTALQGLDTVQGLIDFAQTMFDLARAGLGGQTVGQVTFSSSPAAVATPTPAATATPLVTSGPISSATVRSTGSLREARSEHTATLLKDGRVLVVGGIDAQGYPLASAELYDPHTGKFEKTGSLHSAREDPTATLLLDGRVLVAGGSDATGALTSAEIYDPSSGRFQLTGSMSTPRWFHTATLLRDGRVLVAGGEESFGVNGLSTASAEVFDPQTMRFAPTGSMNSSRYGQSATLLPNGEVLLAGGTFRASGTRVTLNAFDLYDPAAGQFDPAGFMSSVRFRPIAELLQDGRVLLVGGDPSLASAELYDPLTGQTQVTGSMQRARFAPAAAELTNGEILLCGGRAGSNVSDPLVSTIEVFDPSSGSFAMVGDLLQSGTYLTATTLLDGDVLVVGGSDRTPGNGLAAAQLVQFAP